MTIYITRWALHEGILVLEVDDEDVVMAPDGGAIEILRTAREYVDGSGGCYEHEIKIFLARCDWARTEEAARRQVAERAAQESQRLARRAKRIGEMAARAKRIAEGAEVRTKPAARSQYWRGWSAS